MNKNHEIYHQKNYVWEGTIEISKQSPYRQSGKGNRKMNIVFHVQTNEHIHEYILYDSKMRRPMQKQRQRICQY